MINLTENEIAIMKAGISNDFHIEDFWSVEIIFKSKLDPSIARGVISSLVKKSMISVFDYEGKGKSEDMVMGCTEEGKVVCKELGLI